MTRGDNGHPHVSKAAAAWRALHIVHRDRAAAAVKVREDKHSAATLRAASAQTTKEAT